MLYRSCLSACLSVALPLALLSIAGCGSDPGPDPGSPMGPGTDPGKQPQTLSFNMTPFSLNPGEEKILCQYFPPDGNERWITKFTTDMKPGSHHLVVMRVSDTNRGGAPSAPAPCSQVEIPKGFDGMLPGSQTQHAEFPMPDGVAMKLEAYHGLLFQQHYINATQDPIMSGVTWKIDLIDAAKVQQTAAMIFYSNFGLKVPPGPSTATETCKAPADVTIFGATGHMHKRGQAFNADVAGTVLYHTDNWDDPKFLLLPAPGMAVKTGDPITWSCTFQNDTMNTLTFGNSAINNEMCILAATFYPSRDGSTEFLCNRP